MRQTLVCVLLLMGGVALLLGCERPPDEAPPPPEPAHPFMRARDLYIIDVQSVEELATLQAAYRTEGGVLRVPNIAPVRLPPDFASLPKDDRKRLFVSAFLPLILHANGRIEEDRARLLDLMDPNGTAIPADASDWLVDLLKRYRVRRRPIFEPFYLRNRMLPRVDAISVPLTLAQAAVESGWGGSRFAREGNAFFGEWTWDPQTPGIVPARRDPGATHRVRSFPSALASIESYMRNLNSHPAYARFRIIRLDKRRSGEDPLDAYALAEGLLRYSTRGYGYIWDVQEVMWENEFDRYANAELVPAGLDLLTRFQVVDLLPPDAPEREELLVSRSPAGEDSPAP